MPRLDSTAELGALQSGEPNKDYHEKKEKYHTKIWLKRAPLNHFIYRFAIFFATHSQKDWAKGKVRQRAARIDPGMKGPRVLSASASIADSLCSNAR